MRLTLAFPLDFQSLGVEQVWLVHRLDKVTSGLLILALNPTSASYFGELYGGEKADRVYLHAYQLDFYYHSQPISVCVLPSGQFWQKQDNQ
ncbi:hypothetical protein GJV39_06520 [Glaesserella parasuis]|nr:hypothetical protein [Glaesserella parasuis]QGN52146.1 hypothetical protein GJV39_06520 [Glaesserella parasuis]